MVTLRGGDLDCAEKNEMSSHLLYALRSRCLKATRSECSDPILVLGLSLVVQAATQNSKARRTDRQDTSDHNDGSEGRIAAGVQESLSVRACRGLIQMLEAIPAAPRCRGVNGRSTFRSNS